jgi:type I restriction-modification system DNA methylase subunit/very-short-patch-repair endonuclease
MARTKITQQKNGNGANVGFEAQLWAAADKLRGVMDAAEYKHVALGLIFLKYISDVFVERHSELERETANPKSEWYAKDAAQRKETLEDRDSYTMAQIYFVPPEARWSYLQSRAKDPKIGLLIDNAMTALERDNPKLKGVLPKNYAREQIDKITLGGLIDLFAGVALGDKESRSKDLLGRAYEYFLREFALAEGRKGGQFWTPRCVVRLLVAMLEPFKGRVFDPCNGTGGMFVQSEEFVQEHGGKVGDVSIFGQERNQTTYRLCVMNLAIRGIEGNIAWNNEGSFHNDAHKDLRADFVLANPPFNDSDWGGDRLKDDKRWKYGVPPEGNANFAWVQHFIHHLNPTGSAGFVLANGSMSSNQSGEGEIRKNIIEADLVDCMIALPGQLFYSTQIPVCLWFIARDKRGRPSPFPLPKVEGTDKEHYRGGLEFAGLVEKARGLRKKQTPAEEVMWAMLRDRQFLDMKFRRQHQFGDYIADFYCAEQKLVVELDGPIHTTDAQKKHDAKRDAYLTSMGNTVVRLNNDLVLSDPQAALSRILASLPMGETGVSATSLRDSRVVASLPVGETGVRAPSLRDRRGEVLFIDARKLGTMVDRTHLELMPEDIEKVAKTYHAWRGEKGAGKYTDVAGFCKSAKLEEIRGHGHILTPGRYVGAEPQAEDAEPFAVKMKRLTTELEQQFAESAKLEREIRKNLKGLGYGA